MKSMKSKVIWIVTTSQPVKHAEEYLNLTFITELQQCKDKHFIYLMSSVLHLETQIP